MVVLMNVTVNSFIQVAVNRGARRRRKIVKGFYEVGEDGKILHVCANFARRSNDCYLWLYMGCDNNNSLIIKKEARSNIWKKEL